jgi:hypothetical protein
MLNSLQWALVVVFWLHGGCTLVLLEHSELTTIVSPSNSVLIIPLLGGSHVFMGLIEQMTQFISFKSCMTFVQLVRGRGF